MTTTPGYASASAVSSTPPGWCRWGPRRRCSTQQYGFTQRLSARYGTHDRIAVTPAEHVNYGERWDGDRLVLWAEGTVRQDIAYGENLTLTRRYEIEAGTSMVTIRDEVTNEGFFPTPHQILYHFNLGFPFLRWPGRVVAKPAGPVGDLSFSTDSASVRSPDRWQHVTAPEPEFHPRGVRPAARTTTAPDRSPWPSSRGPAPIAWRSSCARGERNCRATCCGG